MALLIQSETVVSQETDQRTPEGTLRPFARWGLAGRLV